MVFLCHDVNDVFMESAKLFKYAKREAPANLLFAGFVISWFVSRMFYFPNWIIRSAWSEPNTVSQPSPPPSRTSRHQSTYLATQHRAWEANCEACVRSVNCPKSQKCQVQMPPQWCFFWADPSAGSAGWCLAGNRLLYTCHVLSSEVISKFDHASWWRILVWAFAWLDFTFEILSNSISHALTNTVLQV